MEKIIKSHLNDNIMYHLEVIEYETIIVTEIERIDEVFKETEILSIETKACDLIELLETKVQDYIQEYDKNRDIEAYLLSCGFEK